MTNFETPDSSGHGAQDAGSPGHAGSRGNTGPDTGGDAGPSAGRHYTRPLPHSPQERSYGQYPHTQQFPSYAQDPYGPYAGAPIDPNLYDQNRYGQQPQAPGGYPQGPYAHGSYPPYAHGPYAQDPYARGQYPQGPYASTAYGYAAGGYGRPAQPAPTPRSAVVRRRWLVGGAAGVVAAALVTVGVLTAAVGPASVSGLGSSVQSPSSGAGSGSGSSGSNASGPGQTAVTSGTASATQQIGIVTVVSVLKYQSAESAGTGMILNSNGEVLTNNHVVNGATSVTVTDESTGQSYRADVVGTSPTKDVAVLQLRNASGLQTAKLASTAAGLQIGDKVIGVGNARGTGTLTAAGGAVTALNRSITASSETGADAEQLHGLIQTNAPIVSGDSGGPLYDSSGQIVGIDTAASAQGRRAGVASEAYAIPIQNAIAVANQIESGQETSTVHIGLPGFIGISTTTVAGGVGVGGVLQGGPADRAGITQGSVITAVGGKTVATAAGLKNVLAGDNPGDRVSLTWTDATGASHTATVTLIAGPAD